MLFDENELYVCKWKTANMIFEHLMQVRSSKIKHKKELDKILLNQFNNTIKAKIFKEK